MQQHNHDKSKHEALKARLRLRIRQIMRASKARVDSPAPQNLVLTSDPRR